MALTRAQMNQKMDEHFGYEARNDVEGVLSTLTHDVVHDIVGSPTGPTYGPEGARGFYEGLFGQLTSHSVRCQRRLYGENFLVDDSIWSGSAPGTPFGMPGHGRPLEFRLLHIVEFSETGDISRENVWLDLGAIQQQLAA